MGCFQIVTVPILEELGFAVYFLYRVPHPKLRLNACNDQVEHSGKTPLGSLSRSLADQSLDRLAY